MNKKRFFFFTGVTALAGALVYVMQGCISIPKGATAVSPFDIHRYSGQWYEIARLDFTFEKNLNNTTAHYSLTDEGTVKVVNRGYNYVKNKWEQAEGKARFVGSPDVARLKVSFFGPFYSAYNVVELDDDYRYALVIGRSTKYCWILARETTIPDEIKEKYVDKARQIGVDTGNLVWVEHTKD